MLVALCKIPVPDQLTTILAPFLAMVSAGALVTTQESLKLSSATMLSASIPKSPGTAVTLKSAWTSLMFPRLAANKDGEPLTNEPLFSNEEKLCQLVVRVTS